MTTSPTIQLIALLLMSAMAGLIVGVCLYRLRAIAKIKRLQMEQHKLLASKDADVESLQQERDVVFQALQLQENDTLESQAELDKTLSRHEALQVHARLQAQRLQTLQTELQSAEEKNIGLQRDFANFKALRARELEHQAESFRPQNDQRLPLLRKRPNADHSNDRHNNSLAATRDHSSSRIDKEFPSLPESELPDSLEMEDVGFGDESGSNPHG